MNQTPRFHASQKGFTIVELMVAGMLGLLLLAGIIQLFLSANQTYRLQSALTGVQEDARYALLVLKENLQLAGWEEEDYFISNPHINFADQAACGDAPCTVDGGAGANDSVMIEFDGTMDCAGNTLPGGNTRVSNTFFVDADNQLVCQGNASASPIPLAENVESFQILYGIDTDSQPDEIANQFVTADLVTDPTRVVSVRLAILVASAENISAQNTERTINVLEQTHNFNDRLAHRSFGLTVAVPNQPGKPS